ncbi:hypothetical protein FS842_011477 [Serendipita sp. 407]|nr:hypothetical protein FS842_011477 [Serendipita sp. 407]
MAQYSQLPSYSDDVKTPLLVDSGARTAHDFTINEEGQVLALGGGEENQSCATTKRTCFFGRMRARCAARCAKKYGPPCENERCVKQARRRRRFRFVLFSLLGLFMFVHLFKGAYMLYTLPKRVNCQEISGGEGTFELPLTRKLMVDYSLTSSTTSIIRSADAPKGVVSFHVEFDGKNPELKGTADEEEDKILFCSAQFGRRASAAGVLTKDKHAQLPPLKKTTIVLPLESDEERGGPMIKFGGKKMGKCAQKMVRKVLKWKQKHGEGDDE